MLQSTFLLIILINCAYMTSPLSLSASILARIAACNVPSPNKLTPFIVDSKTHGFVSPPTLSLIIDKVPSFTLSNTTPPTLTFSPATTTTNSRNTALATASQTLRAANLIKAWRNELSPLVDEFTAVLKSSPYAGLEIERGAASLFAARGFGVHVNGYVKNANGTTSLWVARRSETKGVCPGMLDHIVAGGIPSSHPSPMDNVVKECGEEAGITKSLAKKAVPVSVISYNGMDGWCTANTGVTVPLSSQGFKRDVLFCYDLELPRDFVPVPCDGEVAAFELWSVEKVMENFGEGRVKGEEYKANCYLVVADFLVRKGFVTPEMEDYSEIVKRLRQ